METTLVLAQTATTAGMAAWLTLGVRDNLMYPSINETYTAEVLNMTRMRQEFPEVFEQLAHRAIADRRIQRLAFRCVVLLETLAAIALWFGTIALLLTFFSVTAHDAARQIAMFGATLFFIVWAAMLVVGNHFCYWLCHEGAQNTHYQMTLWGLGSLILLSMSG